MATLLHIHTHPPLGETVAIIDRGSTESYLAQVHQHLGRYFYAGTHRFHVSDDLVKPSGQRKTWQTAAATAVLVLPDEPQDSAAPLSRSLPASTSHLMAWAPPADPVGPPEPTEQW